MSSGARAPTGLDEELRRLDALAVRANRPVDDEEIECVGHEPYPFTKTDSKEALNMVSLERVQAGLAAMVVDQAEAPGLVLEKLDQL